MCSKTAFNGKLANMLKNSYFIYSLLSFISFSLCLMRSFEHTSNVEKFYSMVVEALRRLQSQHTSLKVHITAKNGHLWFEEYPSSDIPSVEAEGKDWVKELEGMVQEENTLNDGLLWRVLRVNINENNAGCSGVNNNGFNHGNATGSLGVNDKGCNKVCESVFIFHLHHVICDGISICQLMLQFVEILNSLHAITNCKSDNLPTITNCQSDNLHAITNSKTKDLTTQNAKWGNLTKTLLPPMDCFLANHQKSFSLTEKIWHHLTRITPTLIKKCILHFKLEYFSNKQEVRDKRKIFGMFRQDVDAKVKWKTGIIPLQLTENETMSVITACKASKTTGTLLVLKVLCCLFKMVVCFRH